MPELEGRVGLGWLVQDPSIISMESAQELLVESMSNLFPIPMLVQPH